MASPSHDKPVNGHKLESPYEIGERSHSVDVSEFHEDLFDSEGNGRPCYLPDSAQDEDNPVPGDDRDDITSGEEASEKSISDIVSKEGKKKSPKKQSAAAPPFGNKGGTGMSTEKDETRSTSSSSVSEDEPPEKEEDGDVGSDRELSSDRGLDGPPSRSSSQGGMSGYIAGSGSSLGNSAIDLEGATSSASRRDGEGNGSSEQQGAWEPGKRHPSEDDTNISWRQHKKHFFILSNAGKPIYSRYGDENKLAGFSATLQAIMSFVQASGDTIHLVRAGDHQILFLVRGPLYLVCISSTDEPYVTLKGQLELLHGQLLLILTNAVEKCFTKNSKFDMRPLLGGTEVVFSSLIHTFNWDPASFIHAYTCLPLPYAARQAAVVALQDMTETGALFALLMCGTKVIGLVGSPKVSLHPDDILLLSNFISSSDSFRTSESFSPVCLPRYNTSAFLYAYVQYLDKDTCLILLSGDSGNFFHLKECRARIEIVLKESEVLRAVNISLLRGGLRVESLPEEGPSSAEGAQTGAVSNAGGEPVSGIGGPAGLWHFIYISTYLDQYVASEFSPPLHSRVAQKRLYRAYKKLHASMHENGAAGPHKMQYRKDENHVLLSWRTSDFELYAAFDPLSEKSDAISVCNRICHWLRDMESEIFLLGAAPFSWMNCILSLCQIQE
ncbi:unnamed protein product [Calypogeia fissa]